MISIVIPVHNSLEYTKKCLKSLFVTINKSRYRNTIKIIVVDDGSTDGTADWIYKNYNSIIVLHGDGNLWWSKAMNMGVKYALKHGTEYLLSINNDNLFLENYIEKIVNFAKRNNMKIVGSKILDLKTKQIWSAGGYFDQKSGKFGMYTRKKVPHVTHYPVDWLSGMGTLFHRSLFEKIGFWDAKRFPHYFGDTDFTLRAKKAGVEPYIYLEAVIFNDTENTGIAHVKDFSKLIESIISRKSHYFYKDSILFAVEHCNNLCFAANFLTIRYGYYIGGFFKHKMINMLHKYSKIN